VTKVVRVVRVSWVGRTGRVDEGEEVKTELPHQDNSRSHSSANKTKDSAQVALPSYNS